MFAFARFPAGHLVKVYDHGDDWQVIVTGECGEKVAEWWFTAWQADREGSFRRALESTCERIGHLPTGEIVCTNAA